MRLSSAQTTEAWPDFAAELISVGSRGQRGHSLSASAGLWQAEANVTAWLTYPVHEFMILLEGQVCIIQEGRTSSFGPGDCFVIPKGLRCVWSQVGRVRKWYVASAEGSVVSGPSDCAFKVAGDCHWMTDTIKVGSKTFHSGERIDRDTIIHSATVGDYYLKTGDKSPFNGPAVFCSWTESRAKM